MRHRKIAILFVLIILGFNKLLKAQEPRVGRQAAARYFDRNVAEDTAGTGSHYLALHLGKYMNSQAYEWQGRGKKEDVGDYSAGITYLVGQWVGAMDMNLRIDFNEFKVGEQRPFKMSLLPLITFPEVGTQFPLYFGFGAGLGVFFRQVEDESAISLDYQLVAGARFFDIYENTGFFIETGLKNHLHLLTSGQLNGTFLALGAVFTF